MQGYQFIQAGKVYRFRTKKAARLAAYWYSKNNSELEALLQAITKIL
jgi:hypothetical protein